MNAIDAVLSRRSIRRFTTQPLTADELRTLLEAAMAAPSAGNEQPWQFIVLTERAALEAIHRIHPYSDMLLEAPAAIVVCGDMRLDKHGGYWVQDCSAATQNVLIAANALELGAVWLGVYPREDRVRDFQQALTLPEQVIPMSLVAIGHPAEHLPPAQRYNPERVHSNHW